VVTEGAYINYLRLKLLLVLAIVPGQPNAHSVQRWGISMPEFIWRGIVSVDLGWGDVD